MDHRVFQFATRGQCIKGKKARLFEHNHVFCFKLQCASIVVLLCTAIWWKSKDAVVHWRQKNFYILQPLLEKSGHGPLFMQRKDRTLFEKARNVLAGMTSSHSCFIFRWKELFFQLIHELVIRWFQTMRINRTFIAIRFLL